MRNFSNLSKIASLALVLFFIFVTDVFAPPGQYNQQQSTTRRVQTPQEKRAQLEQEAPNALTAVDNSYQTILSYVNSAQSPSETEVKDFLKTVASSRKYVGLRTINDQRKSIYHIFSAWVYYFDKKQDRAFKEAASAQKMAPAFANTVKTRLALSLIYKDYTAAVESLTPQTAESRPARPGAAEFQGQSYQPPANEINCDVNAIRLESLGKNFELLPEAAEANSVPWRSVGKVTCALFWKIDPNELDSYAPVEKKAKSAEANDPNLAYMPVQQLQPPVWLQSHELGELAQLKSQFSKDKRAVFAAINLNEPNKNKHLENWLAKNRQAFRTYRLSADQQTKAASIIGESNSPSLVIVAPDSTIRYVGDSNGFLPQMIIQSILLNPDEFAAVDLNEPNLPPVVSVEAPNLPSAVSVPEPNLSAVLPQAAPAEPNLSSAVLTDETGKKDINVPQIPDSNKPKAASAPVIAPKDSDDILAAAEEFEAEKLLSNARSFLQIGNRLPSHMYRDPVEMCRRVMKDYPNTKYAMEAQTLLRNVPAQYREQYKITDQELGL